MPKILFVCHGNICRSPAAQMVLRNMMPEVQVDSAATTYEEVGNGLYPPMRRALERRGIPIVPHTARRTSIADYQKYDYIIGMDAENRDNLRWIYHGDPDHKVSLQMEWAGKSCEVSDPWYTRDFDKALDDIEVGCRAVAETLKKRKAE